MSALSPDSLLATANRMTDELHRGILPFWLRHAVDSRQGGIVGELDLDLAPRPEAERGALLTSRVLWTFSAAFRAKPDPAYRRMADYAYADLIQRFHDSRHGGFYWSIAPDGSVLRDRKQVYGQAFAIYALSEYAAATGTAAALETARATFELLESRARDRRLGGYFEAFARDWSPIADQRLSDLDLNSPKSQNTMLHVMEAYSNLARAGGNPAVARALADCVEIMLERVYDRRTGHLGLFFTEDWRPWDGRVSYGHDIEAAWLLARAAEVLGDPKLRARVDAVALAIADLTLKAAVDADGALLYAGDATGVHDFNKEWWPQAEAVIGFLEAARLSGEARHLKAALGVWQFIDSRLVDRVQGEWHRATDRAGKPLLKEPKISFWKCPYHNGRMCLEAPTRLAELAAHPAFRT